MPPRRRHLILLGICVFWAVGVAILHHYEARYAAAEEDTRDWVATNAIGRRSPQHPQIVFLGIDDASMTLDTLFPGDLESSPALQLMKQGFPWNREVYTHVIERVMGAGARAVVFDMMFPGPRAGDESFRAALDQHRSHVAFGSNLKDVEEDASTDQSTVSGKPRHIVASPTLLPPGPPTDARLGFVNVRADNDGIVRRAHYRSSLLEFFGRPPTPDGEELLSLAARTLEKAGYEDLIPRTHEPVRFRFAQEMRARSLHEIFVESQWTKPPYSSGSFFRDKIVVIGAAGNEAEDRLQTPFGATLGPQIHLSALNAALNHDFLRETTPAENFALIVAAALVAWMLNSFIASPVRRVAMLFGALLFYYAAVQWLFNTTGLYPILLSPLIVLAGSGLTWSSLEHSLARREKTKLRRTLNRYVSKDVVKELVDNPMSFLNSLVGVRKKITVLFSDVRGFTSLTEAAKDPEALVKQLNEYFDAMVRIVFGHKGTLDKFIGDAVMAHWGSIVSEGPEIDACRAVSTAVEMRNTLDRLNADWKTRGMLELHFGIGVNHGDAIVGNLGCEEKMEVSVIGDAVNLASRLEGVTKTYHIDLCIGELVEPLVREKFILRSLDLLVVKGKTRPVAVFNVLDARGERTLDPPWLAPHEEAMRLYRTGDFAAATRLWQEVLAQVPSDGIAAVFIERCASLQALPADPQWAGVYEMKSK